MDLPPFGASVRAVLVPTILAALLVTACSSADARSTTPATAPLRIPSPFEVHQQIGLGDITLAVPSFRRAGEVLTVQVTATNNASTPVTIDPTRDFSVFYASQRRPGTVTAGSAAPIPPGGRGAFAFSFRVPAKYRYPLLWFDGPTSGSPATVVLRGRGA